jgi:hypothetical protein
MPSDLIRGWTPVGAKKRVKMRDQNERGEPFRFNQDRPGARAAILIPAVPSRKRGVSRSSWTSGAGCNGRDSAYTASGLFDIRVHNCAGSAKAPPDERHSKWGEGANRARGRCHNEKSHTLAPAFSHRSRKYPTSIICRCPTRVNPSWVGEGAPLRCRSIQSYFRRRPWRL